MHDGALDNSVDTESNSFANNNESVLVFAQAQIDQREQPGTGTVKLVDRIADPIQQSENRFVESLNTALHSAAYSGLQKPFEGLGQLFLGKEKAQALKDQIVKDPGHIEDVASFKWHAQALGGAAGVVADLAALGLAWKLGRKVTGIELPKINLLANDGNILSSVTKSATVGGLYSALTSPTDMKDDLFKHRLEAGLAGAVSFASMTGISHLLASKFSSSYQSNELKNHFQRGVIGMASGAGGGLIGGLYQFNVHGINNDSVNSSLNNESISKQLLKSTYEQMLVGTVFGAIPKVNTRKIAPEISSAAKLDRPVEPLAKLKDKPTTKPEPDTHLTEQTAERTPTQMPRPAESRVPIITRNLSDSTQALGLAASSNPKSEIVIGKQINPEIAGQAETGSPRLTNVLGNIEYKQGQRVEIALSNNIFAAWNKSDTIVIPVKQVLDSMPTSQSGAAAKAKSSDATDPKIESLIYGLRLARMKVSAENAELASGKKVELSFNFGEEKLAERVSAALTKDESNLSRLYTETDKFMDGIKGLNEKERSQALRDFAASDLYEIHKISSAPHELFSAVRSKISRDKELQEAGYSVKMDENSYVIINAPEPTGSPWYQSVRLANDIPFNSLKSDMLLLPVESKTSLGSQAISILGQDNPKLAELISAKRRSISGEARLSGHGEEVPRFITFEKPEYLPSNIRKITAVDLSKELPTEMMVENALLHASGLRAKNMTVPIFNNDIEGTLAGIQRFRSFQNGRFPEVELYVPDQTTRQQIDRIIAQKQASTDNSLLVSRESTNRVRYDMELADAKARLGMSNENMPKVIVERAEEFVTNAQNNVKTINLSEVGTEIGAKSDSLAHAIKSKVSEAAQTLSTGQGTSEIVLTIPPKSIERMEEPARQLANAIATARTKISLENGAAPEIVIRIKVEGSRPEDYQLHQAIAKAMAREDKRIAELQKHIDESFVPSLGDSIALERVQDVAALLEGAKRSGLTHPEPNLSTSEILHAINRSIANSSHMAGKYKAELGADGRIRIIGPEPNIEGIDPISRDYHRRVYQQLSPVYKFNE